MKLKTFFKWLLFIFFMTALGSCKTQTVIKEVPVEVYTTKIDYREKYVRDSIYIQDSASTIIKDSIVYMYKWRTQYIEKQIHDTIAIVDSIDRPVYITNTVEKITNKLNLFQKIMMLLGTFFCGGVVFYLVKKFKLL